jgi:nitrite reductase/ring-hydroxylating ferredoxin subunit
LVGSPRRDHPRAEALLEWDDMRERVFRGYSEQLTTEENELLTQTGPGTPAGELMRRYWLPVALAEELPPDGQPLRLRVLGEDLVVFRDGQARLGLLGRWCSHRGTDLGFGEVEDLGLRCAMHGWLYDVEGHCLDQPLEPPDATFCAEIQHKAYRCQERAGLIFGYLGPGEPPLLPAYEFLEIAGERRRATKYLMQCNYLQGNEGSLDPLQLWFMQQFLNPDLPPAPEPDVVVEAETTAFGMRVFAVRKGDQERRALEERVFALPDLCWIPAAGFDGYAVHWHVPIDDERHWRYVIVFRRDADLTDEDARQNGIEPTEAFRLARANSREELAQSFIHFTTVMAESQGTIHDRTKEHLSEKDVAIVGLRAAIYGGIQDVLEGADPPHVVRTADANDFRQLGARSTALADEEEWRTRLG